jgi:hypothetical protein
MINRFFALYLFFFIATLSNAQQSGYWDKERSTIRQEVVKARNRIIIASEDLPTGTTEVVFRITLLDENQQMANSLVSVLKAIPDPTGISQGSAGAVLLLSKISGEDKCKYAVFSDESLVLAYKEEGKTDKACYTQNNPINKDAKRLSMTSSSCLKSNRLWFGFENKNWIMNQKIVLEIVPWVDYKLSRGWTKEKRKSILDLCKTTDLAKKIPNPDEYCVCVLEKVQKEYRYSEYQNLLAVEKTKTFKDFGTSCFKELGGSSGVYSGLRNQINTSFEQGKYGDVIEKSLVIINAHQGTALDYNTLGNSYLLTKQYGKAIKYLKEGEKLDDTELAIQLNLAHAYLMNDNFSKAKAIYKKYQSQNVSDSLSWNEKINLDFIAFQKAGIKSDDFDRILKIIDK